MERPNIFMLLGDITVEFFLCRARPGIDNAIKAFVNEALGCVTQYYLMFQDDVRNPKYQGNSIFSRRESK